MMCIIILFLQSWEDAAYASLQFILNTNQKRDPLTSAPANEPLVDFPNVKRLINSVLAIMTADSHPTSTSDGDGNFFFFFFLSKATPDVYIALS